MADPEKKKSNTVNILNKNKITFNSVLLMYCPCLALISWKRRIIVSYDKFYNKSLSKY